MPLSNLEMLTGRKAQDELSGMLIDDDDDITALMIQNTDLNSPNFGNCVLVDKNGTTNYIVAENSEGVLQADLTECFEQVVDDSDEVEAAMEHFHDEIIRIVKTFNAIAAQDLEKNYY